MMRDRRLQGIAWMLASGLCLVAVNGAVRLSASQLPVPQAAFLRFAIGTLFLLPVFPALLRLRVDAGVWRLMGLRGAVHCVAVLGWFQAMAHITVAEVVALGYLTPILVTLGGALIFGERLGWRRMTAIVVAVAGTLIILRPGMRVLEGGHMAEIVAACCFAVSYLIGSRLAQRMPAAVVVATMSIAVTLGLAPIGIAVWRPVAPDEWGLLILTAAFGTAAHYCMTRAFDCAPLTVTQPVTFLQLVWGVLLGWLAFAEPVDPFVVLGGGLIIGAIAWLMWRDVRQART